MAPRLESGCRDEKRNIYMPHNHHHLSNSCINATSSLHIMPHLDLTLPHRWPWNGVVMEVVVYVDHISGISGRERPWDSNLWSRSSSATTCKSHLCAFNIELCLVNEYPRFEGKWFLPEGFQLGRGCEWRAAVF